MLNRCFGIGLISLHQVDTGQELVGGINAVQALTGNAHKARQTCAGTDKHSLIAHVKQLVNGQGTANDNVCFHIYADCTQAVNLLTHNFFGQTELRNAVHQYAACGVQCFVNRYLIAHFCQVAGSGQAAGARTDYRYLNAVLLRHFGLFAGVLTVPVCHKTLQTANADRLVLNAAHALAFALRFLRAHTAANGRKRTGSAQNFKRTLHIFLGYLTDKSRNINSDGAAVLAGLMLAV